LVDFDPKPMLVVKETSVPKAKYPAIDVHNHLRPVVESDEDVSKFVKIMDDCNVKAIVDLDGGWGETLDKHLKRLKEPYPDRFIVYAQVDFSKIDDPDFAEYSANQLEESVKKGAQGLKVHKSLGLGVKEKDGGYLKVDTPKLDKVWAKCNELGIPVEIHTADPIAFFTPLDEHNEWLKVLIDYPNWVFNKPEFYSYNELSQQRNNVIAKHKNTIFISAHLANIPENLQKLSEWLDMYPNFYVDIDARLCELGRQPYTARRFILKYQDRIMFGTDGYKKTPINEEMYRLHWRFLETDDEYFDISNSHTVVGYWRVYGLYLPDEVLEKVYYLNAKKIIPKVI
jgi:predicted TIM-barrel fold metal-dependent hydrolase